ncbi:MAG: hypothetical protein BJ554DRAFT_2594, partial [Olpidium bornovanus]
SSVSPEDLTASLFNLASHALLSTGRSSRLKSQAYAEALVRPKAADLVEQCRSPGDSFSPGSRRQASVTIPVHHLLHHLSLPPHSHRLSLAVLGFCYELGLTGDVVEVPVSTLTGLSSAPFLRAGTTEAVVTAPTSCPPLSARCPRTPPASAPTSPLRPPPPLSPASPAPTPSFRKAELCYIAASTFLSAPAARRERPQSALGSGLPASGRGTLGRTASPLRGPQTPPRSPTPLRPVAAAQQQPDRLALSRLAFLRRYGRPGVRIDQREAEELAALANGACARALGFTAPSNATVSEAPDSVVTAMTTMCRVADDDDNDDDNDDDDNDDDDDEDMMIPDRQGPALFNRRKRTGSGDAEHICRRRRFSRNGKSVSPDRPECGFEGREQRPEPSMVSHAFDTDGLTWLMIAAAHYQHPASQYALGVCYHDGVGLPRNPKRAFSLYCRSAAGGNPRGMAILGYCYGQGFVAEKNGAMALEWYRRAALHNESSAMFNVGYCYEDGIGVEKNPQEA